MPKRKRLGDDYSDERKKRKKLMVNEICQELFDALRCHKIDGRLISETFMKAPKKRVLPDFYEVVTAPIDLSKIQQKIKLEEYDDIEQMTNDIELLVNNAKNYFKSDTQEYQDACDLWNFFVDNKAETISLINYQDESSSNQGFGDHDSLSNAGSETASDDDNPCEELFSAVMTATDDGRSLSNMFQLLPSKLKYPDYYKIINDPIDLKTIATKIQNGVYMHLNDLEKDLIQMVKNAKAYNEPGSQIYKDANSLRKLIINKKSEIDQRKYMPVKSSERIRAKRLLPFGQKWSTITAALKYESESEYEPLSITASSVPASLNEDTLNEEPNESDPEDADNNPQWQLYEAVRCHTSAAGVALSDPFMRLPNRRFYPDYYQEIKQPMSLSKIKSKIKNGFYRSTIEVIDDMNIMFENAKKYNRPDSKIFKDASKLQKIMENKARELVNYRAKDTYKSDSETEDGINFGNKKGIKVKKYYANAINHELKKARRSNSEVDPQLKKRMKLLYKCLLDHTDEHGRSLIVLFMEKPSKKDYPDYYDIIENPIDMKTIDSNIKNDRYLVEDNLLDDLKLMFKNCKQYNEEGSQIYRDAETLESILMEKLKTLGPFVPSKPKKNKQKLASQNQQKLRTLYDSVINYLDGKGRQLSIIFMKLPSKTDYPDYFDIIKRPLDLDKIGLRLKNNNYDTLEDLLSDLVLVFDNACKYNEPDSQLYKDALILQHVALQTKLELTENEGQGILDIKAIVQDLLTNLFISVYNHQDEEGRCYSDSIIELAEQENKNIDPNDPPHTLDMIKRNLDKGKYRRLDRFQLDIFEVFERTRRNSRVDSQAFEDSIELQLYFIRLRNELCRNGDVLQSSALNFTENHLYTTVESLKMEKLPFEQQEIELDSDSKLDERDSDSGISNSVESMSEVSLNDQLYRPGDFVYIEPRERTIEPHIINISRLWRDNMGQIWIYGCWFYRPFETYHIASKKFLEKEVFKSDSYNNAPLSQVVGKCFVMFVKDYFKFKPQGFDDREVYVCESRYFTRNKTFKKIKVWPYFQNYPLTQRERPLPMIRIPSVFKNKIEEKIEKPKEEIEKDDDNGPKIIDIERMNITYDPGEGFMGEEGAIYYEQFSIPSGSFKLGDCCYVRTDQGRNLICRIDKMWVDKDGNAFFHGPWFVQPKELPPLTPRMFYPQEVFLSSIEDTNPLLSICDKCAVLEYKDYITKRPTELPENDVYICESKYLEHEKKFVKLNQSLKRLIPFKPGVIEDEYYVFRKPLVLMRSEYGVDKSVVVARKGQTIVPETPSLFTNFRPPLETENEESNDIPPIQILDSSITSTPILTGKRRQSKRLVTGYIIFASEVRKSVIQANPDCNFGDISRIIGTEWKNLPSDTKQEYEKKAQRQNEESAKEAAREAERFENFPQSPNSMVIFEQAVYECHWENKCDFQCEDSQDLQDHLCLEPTGHVWKSYGDLKDKEEHIFQCLFHGCGRVKKGATPFPSIARLLRHCKDVHVTKQNPKHIPFENRSKNFTPSRRSIQLSSISNNNSTVAQTQTIQATICGPNNLRSTPPPPALNMYESSGVSSSVSHPTLVQTFNNLSGNMPILSPYWAQGASNNFCTGIQASQTEPLFVSTPTPPNRLLHTSTFIKYIERLKPEFKHISNWENQLHAAPENVLNFDKSQLPISWLANGEGNHGNVVNALWALRNFMLQDTLNISRL